VTYLMDVLSNIGAEMIKLELQDTNSSALITVPEQAGFKYVVMPMRSD
jgi:DNA polymerase-3 subunit beta